MKKRALTLLEIMIVILLITTISGVIGYNMKGALEKGRAFRTERAIDQLRDLLLYRLAEVGSPEEIMSDPKRAVVETGLARDPESLLRDGWGDSLDISLHRSRADFTIRSKKWETYKTKMKQPRQDAK